MCSKTYISARSGKPTKRCGYITAHGEETFMEMPLNAKGTVEYTLDEIAAMAILCAWCAKPIFIGEPVTLYSPAKPEFQIPPHAIIHQRGPLQLVGCPRWECAHTGADYCGYWQPDPQTDKGHVYRIPSMIEMLMAHPDAEAALGEVTPERMKIRIM